MRANITYSVDMQNIPKEVARITMSEASSLSGDFYEIEKALRNKNFTEARSKIMSTRQALADADIRLYEVDVLIASYVEIINQVKGQESAPEEETGEDG